MRLKMTSSIEGFEPSILKNLPIAVIDVMRVIVAYELITADTNRHIKFLLCDYHASMVTATLAPLVYFYRIYVFIVETF